MLVLLILITRVILRAELSTRDRLLVRLPFSVYFGWITVATIANVTVWLVSIEWDGFGFSEPAWAPWTGGGRGDRHRHHPRRTGTSPTWPSCSTWPTWIWIKHTSPDGFDGAYPTVAAGGDRR